MNLDNLQQVNLVIGYFTTERVDNLKPEAIQHIGSLFQYSPMWVIEIDQSEEYLGQWALMPIQQVCFYKKDEWAVYKRDFNLRLGVWLPSCDVEIVAII